MSAFPASPRRGNTWIEVDCGVLRRNLELIRSAIGPGTQIIQVVKANAYGHGLTLAATTGYECGVRWFFVARMDEALLLRETLPDANILLLGAIWPSDFITLIRARIVPVLTSVGQALLLAAAARKDRTTLPCHFEIDTGMGRSGLIWERALDEMLACKRSGGLDIRGICTHFAAADDERAELTSWQQARFRQVIDACSRNGLGPLFRHASNSAAFQCDAGFDLDGVRPGILSYGYGVMPRRMAEPCLPALQWKTRVIQVRTVPAGFTVSYSSTHVTAAPTRLATINAGYCDGLSRLMSNTGSVLIGGRRARIAGRVTMNFTVVDIGPRGEAAEGDEVVLIGRQGDESIWADEVARWCQTIPYEVLTSIRTEPPE